MNRSEEVGLYPFSEVVTMKRSEARHFIYLDVSSNNQLLSSEDLGIIG